MKIKYIWKGLDMSSPKKTSMTTYVICNINTEVVQNSCFYPKHRKSEKVHYSEMWFENFFETSFEISIPNATNVHMVKRHI